MTNNIIFTKKIYMLQRTFPPLSPLLSLLSLPWDLHRHSLRGWPPHHLARSRWPAAPSAASRQANWTNAAATDCASTAISMSGATTGSAHASSS